MKSPPFDFLATSASHGGFLSSSRFVATVHCMVVLTLVQLGWAATGGPDADGYTWKDSQEVNGPDFQWIEINATGREVVRAGDNVSSNTPLQTGIGEPVRLEVPWSYRREVHQKLVPSSNGYLSTALGDLGADFTPDCPLPAPRLAQSFDQSGRCTAVCLSCGLGTRAGHCDSEFGHFLPILPRKPASALERGGACF